MDFTRRVSQGHSIELAASPTKTASMGRRREWQPIGRLLSPPCRGHTATQRACGTAHPGDDLGASEPRPAVCQLAAEFLVQALQRGLREEYQPPRTQQQ